MPGPAPARSTAVPGVFTNVTTDPLEVAKASGLYAVVDFGRHGQRHPVHRLDLRDRHGQDQRREGGGRGLHGLQGAVGRRHADRRSLQPHGAADDVAAREVRQGLDLFDRRQRSLLSTSRRRRCKSAGIDPATGYPRQISAGDGSVPAFQRIRQKQYQIATVAEPLHLQGWQMHRRAEPRLRRRDAERLSCRTSTCSSTPTSTRTAARNNIFDPGNGYKDQYKKIWGVK